MSETSRKKRPPKVLAYQKIARIVNGKLSRSPAFTSRHYVTEMMAGYYEVLRQLGDDPDIVGIVTRSALASGIVKYSARYLSADVSCQLTAKEADSCVDYWCYETAPVATPRCFAWPEETGLAYTRLPWKPTTGWAPTWDGIMTRMSNRQAFKAWIGSLFDEKSGLQQYIWLMGDGNDGKGSVTRFLAKIFGTAYCAKKPPTPGDKFWTHGLLGKRLVVFPDCDDNKFIGSGLFKSLTGGDDIPIEAKGKMAYSTKLTAKYLVLSNERPVISPTHANLRRIIYCEMKARKDQANTRVFEEQLWAEGGAFLGQCIDLYKSAGSDTYEIVAKRGEIMKWASEGDDYFEMIFNRHFEVDKKAKSDWLPGTQIRIRLAKKDPGWDTTITDEDKVRKFLRWLERAKGVRLTSVTYREPGPDGTLERKVSDRYKWLVGKDSVMETAEHGKPRSHLKVANPPAEARHPD